MNLKQKFTVGILLIMFATILLQPAMPFVEYFYYQQQTEKSFETYNNCSCIKEHDIAPVANNGDNYLKALVKRVCEDQKKNKKPALPVLQVSVFVLNLTGNYSDIYTCPKDNYLQISTFIIQPNIQTYILDIFHPPTSV